MRAGVALLGLCWLVMPAMASPADKSPREAYAALTAVRVDPASTYQIEVADRIELRRADMLVSFEQGKLAFLAPVEGRITGAVFAGRGHVLGVPRGIVEKQQMARFLGAPVLDQDFTSAILRFTDTTQEELLRQLSNAKREPRQDDDFPARWNQILAAQNPTQSIRILYDTLTQNPRPYFYVAMDGIATGAFDFVVDQARFEPVLLGQPRKSSTGIFYDVWVSYAMPGVSSRPPAFRALQYTIETSILPDNSLDGKTQIRIRAEDSSERLLVLQLARSLSVDWVTGEHGEPLTYFQNEGLNPEDRNTRGQDYLYVVLPAAPARGTDFFLHFHYRGNVIENAGNGVLFVSARESWYPHFGDTAAFADYDLTMRWPRHLRLVATGAKTEEREEGDFRWGHWKTEKPVSVAGFNLGEYVSASFGSEGHSVEVFANRQLEQALDNRLQGSVPEPPLPTVPLGPEGRGSSSSTMLRVEPPAPRPADALKQLGREIDSSIRFYETLSGPFPYQKLSVSQIPGTFGQGWPGLLYLSTYSFLSPDAQQRAGLSATVQEHFTDLVPFHEVAHQWWGNVVGWDTYRDQWINEAIANYLALLFCDTHKGAEHSLRLWLDRYRQHLVEKPVNAEQPNTEIGALDLGNRLTSSRSPNGFEEVIYGKGAWVIHMLREMLRQPGIKNPDARFDALLHTLVTKYAYRGLSTADLQHEVETVMTPAMDLEGGRSMEWFFEQWVRGTGIPHYHVEFNVHHTEKGYLVKGKLFQEDVPHSFIAPVPLFAGGLGHPTPLGVVVAAGPETQFHFTTQTEPHKIVIDPQMTLLCVTQ
jgi:hypothetical protein